VLEASEEVRSYWIHVEAIGNCEELQLYTLGILRYSGAKSQYLDDPGYRSHHSGKVPTPFFFIITVTAIGSSPGGSGTR
jgi:hypothetical protein